MIASLALLALTQVPALPPNSIVDYTGMPEIRAAAGSLQLRTHSATIEIQGETAVVTSTTEVKNLTSGPLPIAVVLPRRRVADRGTSQPSFPIELLANRRAIPLQESRRGIVDRPNSRQTDAVSDQEGRLTMGRNSTLGLRVTARIPLGRAGIDRKQRLAAYQLGGALPVGQLNIAYRYAGDTVFRLPEARPDLGWQIGPRGAFTRLSNVTPAGQVTSVAFYPGGFDNIGG